VRLTLPLATIIKGFLYIDGGEISQLDDGKKPPTKQPSNGINSTLSIDLSKSWLPNAVAINSIPKLAPILSGQGVWPDPHADAFFVWGGHHPYGRNMTKPENWRFEADGRGGGAWSRLAPANPGLLSALHRSEGGAVATSRDAGFWVGGMATGWTELGRGESQPVPGIVSFNMSTYTWRNDSAASLSPFGTLVNGKAQFIDGFGEHGLVVLLGGATYSLVPEAGKPPDGMQAFTNVSFFEPVNQTWYWQTTTGTAPTPRAQFCSVIANDPKANSYEM